MWEDSSLQQLFYQKPTEKDTTGTVQCTAVYMYRKLLKIHTVFMIMEHPGVLIGKVTCTCDITLYMRYYIVHVMLHCTRNVTCTVPVYSCTE